MSTLFEKQNTITIYIDSTGRLVVGNLGGLSRYMTFRERLAYYLLRKNTCIRPQDVN